MFPKAARPRIASVAKSKSKDGFFIFSGTTRDTRTTSASPFGFTLM